MTTVKNEKAGYLIDGSSSGCASVIGIHQGSFHLDIPVQLVLQIYNPAWSS